MKIIFAKSFEKMYKKLPKNIKERFEERLQMFENDVSNPMLNNHKLKGDKIPLLSINITGDFRALYLVEDECVIFMEIGTHAQLYN